MLAKYSEVHVDAHAREVGELQVKSVGVARSVEARVVCSFEVAPVGKASRGAVQSGIWNSNDEQALQAWLSLAWPVLA